MSTAAAAIEARNVAAVRDLLAQGHGDRHIAGVLGVTRHVARGLIVKAQLGSPLPVVAEIEPRTASEFAERITACWHRSREAYIEAGRLLCSAKAALDHGEFEAMVATLPFKKRKAEMLMEIYRDQRLVNPQYVALLPNELGTLYDVTRLDDNAFQSRIGDGTIRADMERRDVAQVVKAERRAARESHLGEMQAAANLKLPDKRYGVILADPEWRFEPWSRETGMDRAPENHYPTSVTEVIAARPVQDIAAKDCALFLWATVPMLPHALAVMAAWGFDYRSHVVWSKRRDANDNGLATTKPAIGTGYWFRNMHELLLLGIKGNIPAPSPGDQWGSMLEAVVGQHSEKPSCFHALIEAYFPHLPKIELNARRARDGWDSWGLDAPNREAAE